jgi:3-isopropylmalate dehydratase small subunit
MMQTENNQNETEIQGVAHLFGDDVNTDIHCSNKYMPGKDMEYVARHAFENLDSEFLKRFKRGDVIVAGKNFGNNSSREYAAQTMRLMGVAAIVAQSFARQFFRSAINNGLPVIECQTEGIATGDLIEVFLVTGRIQVAAKHIRRHGVPLPIEILAIIRAGGLLPYLKENPDW